MKIAYLGLAIVTASTLTSGLATVPAKAAGPVACVPHVEASRVTVDPNPIVLGPIEGVRAVLSVTVTDCPGVTVGAGAQLNGGLEGRNSVFGVNLRDPNNPTAGYVTIPASGSYTVAGQMVIDPFSKSATSDVIVGDYRMYLTLMEVAGNYEENSGYFPYTTRIQRASSLTSSTLPRVVKHGQGLQILGLLKQADYTTHSWAPAPADRIAALQFKRSSETVYSTVKTITTSSVGSLTAATTASVDGCYQISYAGEPRVGSSASPASCVTVIRTTKLTAKASPKKVKKAKTVTVTGKLNQIDWNTGNYVAFSGQPVDLQFRKTNSTTYSRVKTIKSTAAGAVTTTTKATRDGCFRFATKASTNTTASTSAASCVDVRN